MGVGGGLTAGEGGGERVGLGGGLAAGEGGGERVGLGGGLAAGEGGGETVGLGGGLAAGEGGGGDGTTDTAGDNPSASSAAGTCMTINSQPPLHMRYRGIRCLTPLVMHARDLLAFRDILSKQYHRSQETACYLILDQFCSLAHGPADTVCLLLVSPASPQA